MINVSAFSSVSAALASSADPVVYFPKGEYDLTEGITGRTRIYGDGAGETALHVTGDFDAITLNEGSECCFARVSDLFIDGALTGARAIVGVNLKDSVIERLRIWKFLQTPVYIGSGSIHNAISDCRIVVPAESDTSAFNVAQAGGTTLHLRDNYFINLGTGRYFVDANVSGLSCFGNIYEGGSENYGIRTPGNCVLVDAWIDSGCPKYAALTSNNPIKGCYPPGRDISSIYFGSWGASASYVQLT